MTMETQTPCRAGIGFPSSTHKWSVTPRGNFFLPLTRVIIRVLAARSSQLETSGGRPRSMMNHFCLRGTCDDEETVVPLFADERASGLAESAAGGFCLLC